MCRRDRIRLGLWVDAAVGPELGERRKLDLLQNGPVRADVHRAGVLSLRLARGREESGSGQNDVVTILEQSKARERSQSVHALSRSSLIRRCEKLVVRAEAGSGERTEGKKPRVACRKEALGQAPVAAYPVPELAVPLEVVPLLLLLRLLALAAETLALRTPTLVAPSVARPALEPLLLEAPLPVLRPGHRAVVDEVEGVLLRKSNTTEKRG